MSSSARLIAQASKKRKLLVESPIFLAGEFSNEFSATSDAQK
jgi:hypothetical protein